MAFNLKNVFKKRDALINRLRAVDSSNLLSNVGQAAEAVVQLYPDFDYSAVFLTLVNTPKNEEALREICWAIAGNSDLIKKKRVVTCGMWPTKAPTFVPVQIVSARPTFFKNKSRVTMVGRVLAGPGCPDTFQFSWPVTQARYYARHPKGLGFTPNRHLRPYFNYGQLVGCRLFVELLKQDGKVRTTKFKVTESLRKHNIDLTEARFRRGFSCPRNFTHHCHDCPVGYLQCPMGTHKKDYLVHVCSKCGVSANHDSEDGSGICVKCSALPTNKF